MTLITIIGNLTEDVQVNDLQNQRKVYKFSVAVNERIKKGDQYVDGEPTFYRVTAWNKVGEQAAANLRKGERVVVLGKVKQTTYTTKSGETRNSLDVQADEIGKSILFMNGSQSQGREEPATDNPWEKFDSPPF
jgi:single-strand DNA-binding protein